MLCFILAKIDELSRQTHLNLFVCHYLKRIHRVCACLYVVVSSL
jgi:hypothetical protein